MPFPTEDTRTHDVWEWMKGYFIENDGRPPSTRSALGVGANQGRPITTTSIVVRHFDLLGSEQYSLINQTVDGKARGIGIKGGIYVLPSNIMDNLTVDDYAFVLFDADEYGEQDEDDDPYQLAKIDFGGPVDKLIIYSFRDNRRPFVFIQEQLTEWQQMPENSAVITDNRPITLAAIGMGLGVFTLHDIKEYLRIRASAEQDTAE